MSRELDPSGQKKQLPEVNFGRLTGSKIDALSSQLIQQVIEALYLPASDSIENHQKVIAAAMATMLEISPKDALEGVLAAQMVATHCTAMECLRRAVIIGQDAQARNMALTQAQKLLRLYLEQMKALNKYRGKSDQKVVIEHVNVAPGGQAIVGHIEVKKGANPKARDALSHPKNPTLDFGHSTTQTESSVPVEDAKRNKQP